MKENDNRTNVNDPLLNEIAKFIDKHQTNSPSQISSHFSIGFNRACRIIRQIEEENGNNNLLCRKLAE